MTKEKNIIPIGRKTHFHEQTGTIIQFHYDVRGKGSNMVANPDVGEIIKAQGADKKIKSWGSDNYLPKRRDDMLMYSNIVGELISTKRDLLIGQGLTCYREVYDESGTKSKHYEPIPSHIRSWIKDRRWMSQYLNKAVLSYFKHGNIFVEVTLAKDRSVYSMKVHDCRYVRAVEKEKGVIPGYYICADWQMAVDKKDNPVYYLPALPEIGDKGKYPDRFMIHLGDETFYDGYYYHPTYWGGEEWIDLANNIPVWHKANLQNGYSPRFHIKIPKDYFLDKQTFASATTEEAKSKCITASEQAQREFLDKMNKFLSGMDKAGRAVYTIEDFSPIMKGYVGISIEEIKYDMKDDALIKLFEASNQANISAQGFPPILAGIENQGKLSSGSEIRNLLSYFIISKLPRRRADILMPFLLMLDINGWADDELFWTFEDVHITKLDDNKSGNSSTTEDDAIIQ